MAWKNLSEDLGEMFDSFSARTEEVISALAQRRTAWREFRNEYEAAWRKANPERSKASYRRYEAKPERREQDRKKKAALRSSEEWNTPAARAERAAYHRERRAKKKLTPA